jgi:hypothetical protein
MLSRAETFTPVSYWLTLPLRELAHWVEAVKEAQPRG